MKNNSDQQLSKLKTVIDLISMEIKTSKSVPLIIKSDSNQIKCIISYFDEIFSSNYLDKSHYWSKYNIYFSDLVTIKFINTLNYLKTDSEKSTIWILLELSNKSLDLFISKLLNSKLISSYSNDATVITHSKEIIKNIENINKLNFLIQSDLINSFNEYIKSNKNNEDLKSNKNNEEFDYIKAWKERSQNLNLNKKEEKNTNDIVNKILNEIEDNKKPVFSSNFQNKKLAESENVLFTSERVFKTNDNFKNKDDFQMLLNKYKNNNSDNVDKIINDQKEVIQNMRDFNDAVKKTDTNIDLVTKKRDFQDKLNEFTTKNVTKPIEIIPEITVTQPSKEDLNRNSINEKSSNRGSENRGSEINLLSFINNKKDNGINTLFNQNEKDNRKKSNHMSMILTTPGSNLLENGIRMKNSRRLFLEKYSGIEKDFSFKGKPSIFLSIADQLYQCYECHKAINKSLFFYWNTARFCQYSGFWYCLDCISLEKRPIPYKALEDFDLTSYSVSKTSQIEIDQFYNQPILRFEYQNPIVQIHLLYDMICSVDLIHHFMGEKINLVLKDNLFSLKNCFEIYNGSLFKYIEKFLEILNTHVQSCSICKQKGAICKICDNPNKIFVYDMKNTTICPKCKKLYHKKCLEEKSCVYCMHDD